MSEYADKKAGFESKGGADTFSQKPSGLALPPDLENEKKEVSQWTGMIARAQSWRDQIGEKAGWTRFVKEFKGDWDLLQQNVDIPLIPINLVYAFTKTEVARMYFRDPWISVNPKRQEDLGAARIAEQLINYTWGEINLKRELKLAMMDALLVGHGWIKLGYTATFGKKAVVESKRKPGRPKKDESPVDTNEYVKSENVFAYHVPYTHVLFDPSATWPVTNSARWMAFKTVKPMEAVQKSGLYKESVVNGLKPSELPPHDRNTYGSEGKWVVIWEIWDKDHRQVKTVSPGCDRYLKDPIDWPYEFDGFPAEMVSFNPVPNEPYPLSDIAPWEGQVVELMKMHSIMINHLKRWNRQVFVKAGLMTEEQKTNFKNSIDGAIIEYQGNKEDIFVPPYAAVQQDIYGVWNLTMDVFRNVAGQSEVDRGAAAKSNTRTLGELRLAMQGSRTRADEKVDMLEESISSIARKLLSIMQKKFDLPKIIRIVGPKAIQKSMIQGRPSANGPLAAQTAYTGDDSFSVTREDIHGEMDVDTVAGSTIPLNKENQLEIMEKIAPSLELVGIQPGSRASREFGREILRLINIMSLDRIMDIADEEAQSGQGQKPDPKIVKVQADIQRDQVKSQLDAQAKMQQMKLDQQKALLDLEATKAKTQAQVVKSQLDVQGSQMRMREHILKSLMGPAHQGNGGKERAE